MSAKKVWFWMDELRDDSDLINDLRQKILLERNVTKKKRLIAQYDKTLDQLHNDPTSNIRRLG